MQLFRVRHRARIFSLALIGVTALFALQRGYAAEITYDSAYGVMPQFDSSLGTLTGATYSVTGDLNFAIVNNWTDTIGASASFSVGLTINGVALSYRDPNYDPDMTGIFNWGANGLIAPGGSMIHTVDVDLSRTADLSLTSLVGTSTIYMMLGRSEDSDTCMSTDIPYREMYQYLSCPSTRDLTDHITYDYTPADPPSDASSDPPGDPTPLPEPSAALLLGVPALAFLRRRV